MSDSFQDKVVLITGAAAGIGLATAEAFGKEGAKLALVDLNEDALRSATEGMEAADILLLGANVSKEADVEAYVQKTLDKYGRIDVFINNAGVNGAYETLDVMSNKNWNFVLGVNLYGVVYGLKHVIRAMKKQGGGAIVNTASNGGWLGAPGMSAYVASKHAVVGVTKTAALETAKFNIRVNAVSPTAVDTEMMRRIEQNTAPGAGDAVKKAIEANIPMGRYADTSEIANVMLFLSSDKSSYMTGTFVRIDGGESATSV